MAGAGREENMPFPLGQALRRLSSTGSADHRTTGTRKALHGKGVHYPEGLSCLKCKSHLISFQGHFKCGQERVPPWCPHGLAVA